MNEISEIIQNTTFDRLAGMWCEMNTYRVPKELQDLLAPADFHNCKHLDGPMKQIKELIGLKRCLAEWNKNRKARQANIKAHTGAMNE